MSASDFFWTNNSIFSLAELLALGLFVFLIKIFEYDEIQLKEPINRIFFLNFWVVLCYDKIINLFIGLFLDVNALLNILAPLDVCFCFSKPFLYFYVFKFFINLLSASDFFLTNKSIFSLAELLARGLFVFLIKIF